MKRSHLDSNRDFSCCCCKKLKLENSYRISFEDLPNEILYEIFDYLNHFHAYQAFFYLNHRLKTLFFHFNSPIQIQLPSTCRSSFEDYYQDVLLPNKQRIQSLHLSNPFTVDMIFSPSRLLLQFHRLEKLHLDRIQSNYLPNLFLHLSFLPKLSSLTIHPLDLIENFTDFYRQIFRLPKLRFCQIEFETKYHFDSLTDLNQQSNSIEYLIIKHRFPFHSLYNLLFSLPQLQFLSINYLDGSFNRDLPSTSIQLRHLKKLSLKLDLLSFNRFEKFVQQYLHSIEYLCLTTEYDPAYLDAKRWQDLIEYSLPHLRTFDLNHDGLIRNSFFTYHNYIEQFNSPFWIEKRWFFTHQHDWQERLDTGIFHSIKPYRRKDFTFYWNLKYQKCLQRHETNLHSVEHVRIGSRKATTSGECYFPNAIELTIKYFFKTFDSSMAMTLNRLVPLNRIQTLTIDFHQFPFEQIVRLIDVMPSLETLIIDSIVFHEDYGHFIQISDNFNVVSRNLKIKRIEIRGNCSLENIEMIVYLFPKLEYFKGKFSRKERESILRCLLTTTKSLYFLCLSQIGQSSFKEISTFIDNGNFFEDYCIKSINRDLFLWW